MITPESKYRVGEEVQVLHKGKPVVDSALILAKRYAGMGFQGLDAVTGDLIVESKAGWIYDIVYGGVGAVAAESALRRRPPKAEFTWPQLRAITSDSQVRAWHD